MVCWCFVLLIWYHCGVCVREWVLILLVTCRHRKVTKYSKHFSVHCSTQKKGDKKRNFSSSFGEKYNVISANQSIKELICAIFDSKWACFFPVFSLHFSCLLPSFPCSCTHKNIKRDTGWWWWWWQKLFPCIMIYGETWNFDFTTSFVLTLMSFIVIIESTFDPGSFELFECLLLNSLLVARDGSTLCSA